MTDKNLSLEYDAEGRCKLEDKLINALDLLEDETFMTKVDITIGDLTYETVWTLGQSGHEFQAPRLEAIYRELVDAAVETAERAAGWDPNP